MDKSSLWQAILGELEVTLAPGNFHTFFKPSEISEITDTKIVIAVKNVFIRNHIEKKWHSLLVDIFRQRGYTEQTVMYTMLSSDKLKSKPGDESVVLQNQTQTKPAVFRPSPNPITQSTPPSSDITHSYRQGLSPRYTFENFIVGSGNELAYAACQGVAVNPGTKYNPLFLYGGVGIGKTHLIQAVGNGVIANNPNAKIVYVSTEQFIQEFLDAVRYKKNTDFAAVYRGADVLIIDDIQFIANKEKTQDEFFHTFNALHQANRQIIMTSDRPPKEIPTLTDRLRTRFEWGMSIDMHAPDFETRCAIVQSKAANRDFILKPDVVDFLANLIQTNIRELEGILNKLIATCEVRNLDPTIDVAQALFGNVRRPRHLSAKQVVEKTAKHFRVSVDELLGPKRDKDIVMPRQVAMYILRSELKLSFPKIARELGRNDHTTAIHSINKIATEEALNSELRSAIQEIRERLYA